MRKILQHPLLVPLVAVAVILLVIAFGKNYERASLSLFLRGIAPAPYFVQPGSGDDGVAWHVRTVSDSAMDRELAAPAVVLLEDNTEGVFQSSPHAPIDLALIFRNMARLGEGGVAVGAVMAWEAPDVIGLAALERSLEEFDSVVTSVPLTRGTTPESMPPAFRRASVSMDAVRGDASGLLVVNRQAIPGALLGGGNALAGFTFIESAGETEQPFLMARWEDRVVFSFSFLAAMNQAGLDVGSLQIRPGSHIRVGTGGWIIPIDESGRLTVRAPRSHGWRETPAEWLLDADAEMWAGPSRPGMWLLRDDRSALDALFRDHSSRLVPEVKALASGAALTEPREFYGVSQIQGWLLMGAVVVLLSSLCRLGGLAMQAGLVLTLIGLGALQWTALSLASLWMPGMPAILAANVIWVLAYPIMRSRRAAHPTTVATA